MNKIHVLTHKEMIDPHKLGGCFAVVFDILLATSFITDCLMKKANKVIVLSNEKEAKEKADSWPEGNCLLFGEKRGNSIEGFLYPDPLLNSETNLKGKAVILCTTNGTVAIEKVSPAKRIYTACFLDGQAVANRLQEHLEEQTVLLICSGSLGSFNLEDFLGAGFFIKELLQYRSRQWVLTDAARAAYAAFQNMQHNLYSEVLNSATGKYLVPKIGDETIQYVIRPNSTRIVAQLIDHALVNVG